MQHLDDDAIAQALNLEHYIDADLRDPQKSIIVELLASARKTAIEATKLLLDAPPTDANRILTLQAQVRRFSDTHRWLIAAQTRAGEAWALLPDEERQAVLAFTDPHSETNDA